MRGQRINFIDAAASGNNPCELIKLLVTELVPGDMLYMIKGGRISKTKYSLVLSAVRSTGLFYEADTIKLCLLSPKVGIGFLSIKNDTVVWCFACSESAG